MVERQLRYTFLFRISDTVTVVGKFCSITFTRATKRIFGFTLKLLTEENAEQLSKSILSFVIIIIINIVKFQNKGYGIGKGGLVLLANVRIQLCVCLA